MPTKATPQIQDNADHLFPWSWFVARIAAGVKQPVVYTCDTRDTAQFWAMIDLELSEDQSSAYYEQK